MRSRPSSRLIVLDPDDRVLLFHFVFDEGALAGNDFWATPGGALEDGERYRDAARRELIQETGIVAEIGDEIASREAVFVTPDGEEVDADERYFLVRAADNAVDEDGQEPTEARYIKAYRWWPLSDLRKTTETVFPEDIVDMVEQQLRQPDTG